MDVFLIGSYLTFAEILRRVWVGCSLFDPTSPPLSAGAGLGDRATHLLSCGCSVVTQDSMFCFFVFVLPILPPLGNAGGLCKVTAYFCGTGRGDFVCCLSWRSSFASTALTKVVAPSVLTGVRGVHLCCMCRICRMYIVVCQERGILPNVHFPTVSFATCWRPIKPRRSHRYLHIFSPVYACLLIVIARRVRHSQWSTIIILVLPAGTIALYFTEPPSLPPAEVTMTSQYLQYQ